jgi:hypothetical protein
MLPGKKYLFKKSTLQSLCALFVLKDGNHTGAMPGRFIKDPGFAINN